MTIAIVVAAYILSVALYIVVNRMYLRTLNYRFVFWPEIVISVVPVLNVVFTVISLIDTWENRNFAMPRWLIRLYGGR